MFLKAFGKTSKKMFKIQIFFDIQKKLKKYPKKSPAASRPIFTQKEVQNTNKKKSALRADFNQK